MDSDIQTHEFNESLVIVETQQRSKIVGVIFCWVDCGKFALTKDVTINPPCDSRELGDPRSPFLASKSGDE